jgi:hypothetical protein
MKDKTDNKNDDSSQSDWDMNSESNSPRRNKMMSDNVSLRSL